MFAGSYVRMRRETLRDSLQGRRREYWSQNANPPKVECVLVGSAEVRSLVQTFLSCVPGFRGSILALLRASLHSERTSLPPVDRTGGGGGPFTPNPFKYRSNISRHSILSIMRSATSLACLVLLTSGRVT